MAEAYQAGHPFMQVAVARCELASVDKQEDEIQLIGAVGVRGMALRLDVRSVVVQDVEDEVRLMLVRTDDACVAWDMVGDQRVGAHAFLQTEVFAAMPGVDGMDLCFDTLTVAAGMLQSADIVLVEHRQGRCGIANPIVPKDPEVIKD